MMLLSSGHVLSALCFFRGRRSKFVPVSRMISLDVDGGFILLLLLLVHRHLFPSFSEKPRSQTHWANSVCHYILICDCSVSLSAVRFIALLALSTRTRVEENVGMLAPPTRTVDLPVAGKRLLLVR